MRERDNPINVRKLCQGLIAREWMALKGISDEAGRVGAAIYRCQDADVVTGRDTTIGTNDALERGRLREEVGRLRIHAVGVILREVAHAHVLHMHMLPWSDGFGRKADNLIVLPDLFALFDPAHGHLVSWRNPLGRDHPVLDWRTRQQGYASHNHVVSLMEADDGADSRHIGPRRYRLLFLHGVSSVDR